MLINQNDIIYFVITDRFYGEPNPAKLHGVDKSNPKGFHGGNLNGLVEKIPYFKKLGVTAIWITPVYLQMENEKTLQMGMHGYHGYWALDFNRVDPHLYLDNGKYEPGSKLYLKDIVDIFHKNGLKLILDMVVNHTGYLHPSITETETNPTPIRKNWFNNPNLNLNDSMTQGSLAGLPDMDLDNLDVVDYHIQTIRSWIEETGIDAIRMDTAKHVERSFWNHLKTQIRGKYSHVTLIGEVFAYSIDELSDYQKYLGFDYLFDFPLQETLKNVFVYGAPLTVFHSPFDQGTGILEKDSTYSNHNRLSVLLDNHDLAARYMNEALQGANGDKQKAAKLFKMSLTFIFTVRGIPQIYYGTEIGMEGAGDPDNRRDFPWEIFNKNYTVKNEYPIEKEIFDHTCKLIQIRQENEALSFGSYVCLYVDSFIFVYLRFYAENVVIVAINNGWDSMPNPLTIDINNNGNLSSRIKNYLKNRQLTCQLCNETVQLCSGTLQFLEGKFKIQLDGKTAAIYK